MSAERQAEKRFSPIPLPSRRASWRHVFKESRLIPIGGLYNGTKAK